MAFRPRELWTGAAAVAITAALVWFGAGLAPVWPLMWLAPLPVLWYALRRSAWRAGLVAFSAWLLGSTNTIAYFRVLGRPFLAWLADFGGMAVLFAFGVVLFRKLVRRNHLWAGAAALPALFVSVDWLRYWVTPHGTSADLAYTQLRLLPFVQLASLTGPWGMTFLLLWTPCVLAAFCFTPQARQARNLLFFTCAVLAGVFGYGTLRLALSHDGPGIVVGLVASDQPADQDVADAGVPARNLIDGYAANAKQLIARGATVVVMPEKVAVVRDSDRGVTDESLQQLADSTQAAIVMGELHISPRPGGDADRFNRAVMYLPGGSEVTYDKQHMLPPFESRLKPGTQLLAQALAGSVAGVAICKDMDFPAFARRYGELHAGVMLVPAWDFQRDRVWHGHMAILRGVESGYTVVRAARGGSLLVSDAYGRILAETPSGAAEFATLLARVPVQHHATLYQAWGDWFAWVAVAILALVLADAFRSGLRARGLPGS